MKADIHPKIRQVIFQDTVTGAQYRALSSVKTDHKVTIDGTEYPLVKVDVSSASHPFYTGTQRILDTAGRVEKFGTRYGGKVGGIKDMLKGKAKAKAEKSEKAEKPEKSESEKSEKPA
jgi:large subunit ribosomal protein L31